MTIGLALLDCTCVRILKSGSSLLFTFVWDSKRASDEPDRKIFTILRALEDSPCNYG